MVGIPVKIARSEALWQNSRDQVQIRTQYQEIPTGLRPRNDMVVQTRSF